MGLWVQNRFLFRTPFCELSCPALGESVTFISYENSLLKPTFSSLLRLPKYLGQEGRRHPFYLHLLNKSEGRRRLVYF